MTLHDLQRRAWQIAEAQGQHDGLRELSPRHQLLIRCSFLHGEVGEIGDIAKKHGVAPQQERLAEECADVAILLGELCAQFCIDLERAVLDKLHKNSQRPYGYGTPLEKDKTCDHTL